MNPAADPKHPQVLSAREEERLVSGERLRLIMLAILTVIMVGLCVVLAVPFLPALTWGVALAIIAWPLHVWICRRISWQSCAAGVTLTVVVLVIVVPGIFVAYQIASEATSAADRVQQQQVEGTLRGALLKVPALRDTVAWMDRMNFNLDEAVRNGVRDIFGDVNSLIQGSVMALIQFALALFILFYLLRDRPAIMQTVRGLMPLSRAEADRVFRRVTDSVHATVNGQVLTSVINGVVFGLLFWALGLPSPVLWGVVIMVLGILPVLGTFIIWAPAAAYLFLSDNVGGGLIVIATGVASAIFVDNLLYTRLAGERMRLHPVPTLLSFLGGLAVFGMSGIIIGPAVVVTAIVLLEVWGRRSTEQTTDTLVRRLEQAADEPEEEMAESDAKAADPVPDEVVQGMEKAADEPEAEAAVPADEKQPNEGPAKPKTNGRHRSRR